MIEDKLNEYKMNEYYVKHKNNKVSEFNINDLNIDHHVTSFQDLNKLCNKYTIDVIHIYKDYLYHTIPSKIKSIINNINHQLKKKCKELSIIVDLGYKIKSNFHNGILNKPLICLYYKDSCISRIFYYIENNYFIISSYTDDTYRNNKFNSLLRAIAVIISKYYDVEQLVSYAINPISVYTLSKYFIVTYDKKFTTFLNHHPLTFELCKEYMKHKHVIVYVNISDENIQRAIHVYQSLFDDKLKCP
jgi:hypothetical protein